jgi:hypothetical protein
MGNLGKLNIIVPALVEGVETQQPQIRGQPAQMIVTLFLHENVQTEAVSIQFEHFDANRGHFYSDFGR